MRSKYQSFLTVVTMSLALPCLHAGEVWDSSFKLSLGQASGAKDANLGSNTRGALAIEGSYPLFKHGSLVFDGGYQMLLKANTESPVAAPTNFDETQSKGYFGSALYRYTGFTGMLDGAYAHAGLRYSSMKTSTDRWATSAHSGNPTELKGSNVSGISPVFGVGVRFTEKLSLDLNTFSVKATSVDGSDKKCAVIELALGVHL